MALVQRITDHAPPAEARTILVVAVASLLLVGAVGFFILLGGQPLPVAQAATRPTPPVTAPLAKANDPLCAAALAKARDTRALTPEDAIAASTAMLRACEVR